MKNRAIGILFCFLFTFPAVANEKVSLQNHSYSSSDVVVTHLDLDLKVDFDTQKISGRASLKIQNPSQSTKLVLDTRDLTIKNVTLDNKKEVTPYSLGDNNKIFGQPLTIQIQPTTQVVNIEYETSPTAAALQWLSPSQTAGKKNPYLLTQSEPILARSWIPCQDKPEVRMTYTAKVEVPKNMLAIMSAEHNPQRKNSKGFYTFEMKQPIPSYLIALAVGDIAFQKIDERTGVYAEPPIVKKAAWEFADMGKMVTAAEKLYGKYRWGRYDVLVLPPSFPYGGMENPRLTFLSPTILAGDRSLVSVVTHELAHSWSGNLVTNATWEDFWLNEGFTNYFQRRIDESLYGKVAADMDAMLAIQSLQETIADPNLVATDKQLHTKLEGRDPDDAVNDIAYEKGSLFLRTIEETVGRKKWDQFLTYYFNKYAFQSMTTEKFLTELRENLLKNEPGLEEKLQIQGWVYGPTVPSNLVKIESDAFSKVDFQLNRFQKGTLAKDLVTKKWTTPQWLRFLTNLPKKLTPTQMANLDQTFHFTQNGNAEILSSWLEHAIRNQYEVAYPALRKFLTQVGRRKYLKPLYAEMAKTEKGLGLAKEIYAIARPGYHPVAVGTIDGLLKWNSKI